MKVFVNGLKKGGKPVAMEDYLDENKPMRKEINDYNLFYVIRPKSDASVFKIGISSGNSRLLGYVNTYGFTYGEGCSGVLLWYLVGTKKVEGLGIYQSMSRKREAQLIEDLKPKLDRGLEYFRIRKDKLYKAILDAEKRGYQTKTQSDKDNERKLKDSDRIIRIMDHKVYKDPARKNEIKALKVKWNRPFNTGVDETWENMQRLKRYNNMSGLWSKLRRYAKQHDLVYKKS